MKSFQKVAFQLLAKEEFQRIADRTHELLTSFRQREKKDQIHLAMTCHMLESLGFSALHAGKYLMQSRGETAGLTHVFLTIPRCQPS